MLYPFMRQEQDNDCGYACLAMLVSYHQQLDLGISELKSTAHAELGGGAISIAQLCQLSKRYKIDLQPYEVDWNHFLKLSIKQPVIMFCENEAGLSHFVVVYEKTETKMLIADPAKRKINWISIADWHKQYRNVCIFSKKLEQFKMKHQSFWMMLYFLKNEKLWIVTLIVLAILANVLLVLNKTFIKVYLDQVNKMIDNQILSIVLGFIALMVVKAVCDLGFKLILNRFQLKMNKKCHLLFLKNMNKVDMSLYEQFDNSDWLKRLEDVSLLVNFISFNIFNLFLQTTLMLVASILILTNNMLIFVLILIENMITFVLGFVFMKVGKMVYSRWFDHSLTYQQKILQYFSSFSQRRARGLDHFFYLDLMLNSDEFYRATEEWQKVNYVLGFWQTIAGQLMNLLIFYFAYFYIIKGTMNVGDLLFYTALTVYFSGFSGALNDFLINRHQREKAFQRCCFVLFWNDDVQRSITDYNQLISKIVIKNLSYKIGHTRLYQRFDLIINGWTYIKGSSGSGKTTLLQIIDQMRDNYFGEIILENSDIRNWTRALIDLKIIFIQQNEYLFTASTIDNVLSFIAPQNCKILSDARVQKILKLANLDLTKMVVNNGENLSKGQRQIVVFLSMLNQDRAVYLIDEALSNVDCVIKPLLMDLLLEMHGNKIVVYCGHDVQLEDYFKKDNIIDLNKRNEVINDDEA